MYRRPSLGLFAKSLFWPSFLYAWYLAPILQGGRVGHCTCPTDGDSFAHADGLWLRIPLSFQAHTLLCQGLHAGLNQSASLFAAVRTSVATFDRYAFASVTGYTNWFALRSSFVRCLQLCTCSSTRRCWTAGFSLTSRSRCFFVCLTSWYSHAYARGYIFIRRVWQETISASTAVQVMGILWCIVSCQELYAPFLRFLGLAHCWCLLRTLWPCLCSRNQHHCKYVVPCKYIASSMGTTNFLVLWNSRLDRVLLSLKKFRLWSLGDGAQASIRIFLTRLHMTLVNLVGVQQGGLLGGRHHVPDKLRIFRILVLFLQLVRLREEGDTFVLPESAPRAYGRARDQLVKRIGPRTWYPLLSRQHRFRYHPYDHWDGRGKPLLPWMKLALTRPPLPLMGIKAAPRCLLMMNRTIWTLTTCLQLPPYIPMILMRCFVPIAMPEHLLWCVHILCKWQCQFVTVWSSAPTWKTALFLVSQWPMFSTHNRCIIDHVDTQVAASFVRSSAVALA